MKNLVLSTLMPVLPKNHLSHWVGRLVHYPLPGALARLSVAQFAKAYNINMQEAEFGIEHYRTIGDLFCRRLKPEARPISEASAAVHPCDAVITEAGRIAKLALIQAKGHNYTVPELIRSSSLSLGFEGGDFLTYYLCPTDYHRVHSPVTGEIEWMNHVPGELWPVNSWSVERVDRLFAVNERIAISIKTERGSVVLVMVAATNVGNMSLSFDSAVQTNQIEAERKVREKSYAPPIRVRKGEELGIFHMGSTVVALFPPGFLPEGKAYSWRGQSTKMGTALA